MLSIYAVFSSGIYSIMFLTVCRLMRSSSSNSDLNLSAWTFRATIAVNFCLLYLIESVSLIYDNVIVAKDRPYIGRLVY